jgi:hypothetical protein
MTDARFSERDVEQIIARAIQLDVSGNAMSLERLREVAGELNISPEALNQALAERNAAPHAMARRAEPETPEAAPPVSRPWNQWFTAASVGAGALTGGITGASWLQQDEISGLATTAAGAAAVTLLWLHRKSRNGWEMSVQMLVLWSSYAYAFAATRPGWNVDDAIGIASACAATSLFVGNVVLFGVRRWSTRAERRARKAAKRARLLEMRAEKATAVAQRAAAALRGDVVPTLTPRPAQRAGVRAIIARLTGSFHTPNPSR